MGQQFKGNFVDSLWFTLSKYNSFFSALLHCHPGIHDCPFFLVTCRLALHTALCGNNGKSSHISGRDRFLQTIVFQKNVHFYKCDFRYVYLHTDVYALISAVVHKRSGTSILKHSRAIIPSSKRQQG